MEINTKSIFMKKYEYCEVLIGRGISHYTVQNRTNVCKFYILLSRLHYLIKGDYSVMLLICWLFIMIVYHKYYQCFLYVNLLVE
jgi:hypothetical protein